jgi:putative ABC transport system permease protein
MIRNFFSVALRTFLRQRFYSFINVIGLASGLTCALFSYLWVSDEVNKDKFHAHINQIYQIVNNIQWDGEIITWEETPGPLAEEIKSSVSEVDKVARLSNDGDQLFQVGDKNFLEKGYFADPDFFQIFSYKIARGNSANPLTDKRSIAISQSLAKKLFGEQDPIGKVVTVQKKYEQKVSAVFENAGTHSSLQFDFIMPFEIHKEYRPMEWSNSDYLLYVKLNDNASAETARKTINAQVNKVLAQFREQNKEQADEEQEYFYLQPFGERYLNSLFQNGVPVGGRIKYVKIFSVVAVFILVIACINFMNMATARAANRGKEVGVRKVIGAQRKSLIAQFVGESLMVSAFAMLISLSITYLLLPLFNELVGKQIEMNFTDPLFLLAIVAIVLITGLLAGSYPAFVLSAYKPVSILKGNALPSLSGASLRRVLVTFQFILTVVLIASALVIYQQIDFIQHKNLGYNRESVLYFRGRAISRDFETFKNEVLQSAAIKNVSRAGEVLVKVNNQNSSVSWSGKPEDSQAFFRTVSVDYDFIETMGLQVMEGRSFSREFNDTSSVVLTERAVEVMGLQNPIGARIVQWGIPCTVVGVVKDFHSRSMAETIDPIVFLSRPQWAGNVHIRFEAGKTQEAIAHLEKIYKRYNPEFPFNYSFLDEDFDKLYNTEKIAGSLALSFTFMAIIISGLGLLGLAAYTAERKRKEISIRKTLGASVASLVAMISREFVRLSLIAAAIGCPLAYYLMEQFLSGYAYHTDLTWQLFAVTALGMSVICLATVIYQVLKAAVANPVDALRNE